MDSLMLDDIYHGDCLKLLPLIPDKSIELILSDLPYQITQNSWDVMIPMSPLWEQFRRVIKPNGVVVLTSYGLFSAKLMLAAPDIYKYSLVWQKNKTTNFLNAKRQPLRKHEDILVFYDKQCTYNPQKTTGHKPVNSFTHHRGAESDNYGKTRSGWKGGGATDRYPTSIIQIPVLNNDSGQKIHPTQKPLALAEYLVKTFSNEGDTVLDPAAGSGTMVVAAKKLKRHYIGMEISNEYYEASKNRLLNSE